MVVHINEFIDSYYFILICLLNNNGLI